MSQKIISSEQDVRNFLQELKELLTDHRFDISKDLDILPKKKNESPIDPFTTVNTLLQLDFNNNDVLDQLLALDVSQYLETFIDDKDVTLPPFYAFGKIIKIKMCT